jgi:hypothetical protein
MNRDQFRDLYRALRCKARREQAGRPENIKGVFIIKDGIQIYDSNWPDNPQAVMKARTVSRLTPKHLQNTNTPRITAASIFAMAVLRNSTPQIRRTMIDLLRQCPPIPLPR